MKTYLTFISNDLKIVFRDKTLILMFFLPIILILVCRILVPILASYIPEVSSYYWMILAAFCTLSASTPAFLTAFLMLDEKDENLIPVLKVSPYPYSTLIAYRVSFLMLNSFIFSIIFLIFNGLKEYSYFNILQSSILAAFIPAILILFIVPFAKNKIEGVTLFKIANSILFIPLIAFFISPAWKNIFGIIPFYWVFDSLSPLNEHSQPGTIFLAGILVNAAYLYLLALFFKKRFIRQVNY